MAPTSRQIIQRRRGLALAALVLIIALVVWLVQAFGAGSATPDAQPDVSATTSETAAPAEITDCGAGLVTVQAFIGVAGETEATRETRNNFKSSESPVIWYQITNIGPIDCTFNVGARVTFFTITSGDQTYWSSKDCDRTGLTDSILTLAANQSIESQSSPWEKVRSTSEGCGAGQEAVPTGGASYHLKVEVNGVISDNSQQFILN